ncbi:NRDE family protein [Microbacterium oryzae]|uniref:NRDE family protein n=1 Tax=Microbacterium oryzae TaxID=743009 RepID=UPI0025B01CEA|nr:NRDE family protein [Microbacterium oryzae]MDN3311245.1 NRDE family protein [Microbacterium oryzae]
MCTVIIRVPEVVTEPIRLLAVRDEDPDRPWNPLGPWWSDRPGVVGVQDRLAGGAWLAAREDRLAVLLNRAGEPELPVEQITSRGAIVLDAVVGVEPTAPSTLGFNLVTVAGGKVSVSSWDGRSLQVQGLAPGTHMVAHDDVDDRRTPRIAAWLDVFASASTGGASGEWWREWLEVLERSARIGSDDDRAIIRDNRPHGYPTQSLLACVATIDAGGSDVKYAELARPGKWSPLSFA